jgi:hypothetical protein
MRLGTEYRSFSSSLCNFLHYPVTSSLLGANILLKTLFSNTLSLRSSLNISDQVSHPYRTTGKIIVLYILIFKSLDSKLEDERYASDNCRRQTGRDVIASLDRRLKTQAQHVLSFRKKKQ